MRRLLTIFCAMIFCAAAWAASFPGADAYMAARDAELAGRNADAITIYENRAKADPALAGFARVRAALCRTRGGDKDGAIAQLRELVNSVVRRAANPLLLKVSTKSWKRCSSLRRARARRCLRPS